MWVLDSFYVLKTNHNKVSMRFCLIMRKKNRLRWLFLLLNSCFLKWLKCHNQIRVVWSSEAEGLMESLMFMWRSMLGFSFQRTWRGPRGPRRESMWQGGCWPGPLPPRSQTSPSRSSTGGRNDPLPATVRISLLKWSCCSLRIVILQSSFKWISLNCSQQIFSPSVK